MNCEELQINDWVEYNGLNQKVKEISGLDNEVYLTIDECIDCTHVNPILITPEILEKNGFEKRRISWVLRCEKSCIWVQSINGKWSIEVSNTLAGKDERSRCDLISIGRGWSETLYVHRLQHALRLCEIEHEIIL